jgi:hypothetical protein
LTERRDEAVQSCLKVEFPHRTVISVGYKVSEYSDSKRTHEKYEMYYSQIRKNCPVVCHWKVVPSPNLQQNKIWRYQKYTERERKSE